MKKANFLYLFLLFFFMGSHAQEVSLNWSNEIINPNKAKPGYVLFKYNEDLFVISYYRKNMFASNKIFFEVYDAEKGKLKSSKEFEFKKGKEDYDIESYILLDDKVLLVSTISDKEKYTIYTNYCDFKGKLIGKWNEIDVIKKDSRKDRSSIRFFYLKDKKKLYAFKPEFGKKKDKERYTLTAYDDNFETIFKKRIILPYEENTFSLTSLFLDSQERAFITGSYDKKRIEKNKENSKSNKNSKSKSKSKSEDEDDEKVEDSNDDSDEVIVEDDDDDNEEDGKKKKKKGKEKDSGSKNAKVQRYVPTILTFNFATPDSVEAKEFKIDLKGKFVSTLKYKILKDDKLLIVGLYNNSLTSKGPSGVFAGRADLKTLETPTLKLEKFDDKFLKRMCRSDKDKVIKRGVPHLKLYDIFTLNDGSFVISGDDYHMVESCSYDSRGNRRCVYYYYYNDIYNIKFNADCVVDWFAYIPRYQVTVNDGGYYSGHASLMKNNKIYYVYNDNPKNYDKPKKSKKPKKPVPYFTNDLRTYIPASKSGTVAVLASINMEGELTKELLPGPAGDNKSSGSKGSSKGSKQKNSKDQAKNEKEKQKTNRKYRFVPRNSFTIQDDEFVSFSLNTSGKSYRLVNFKVTE